MALKTTLAILGATGSRGRKMAGIAASSGHRILLMSEDPVALEGLLATIQSVEPEAIVEGIDCLRDACWEADIIVLAVPTSAEADVARRCKDVATQKIVVRIPESSESPEAIRQGLAELASVLPDSKIVTINFEEETVVSGLDAESVGVIRTILAPSVRLAS